MRQSSPVIELQVLTRLAVVPGNENAAALYRRNGFHLAGERGDLMPDGVRREHVMAKDLATCA
jgi:ribosomal protein S18 acetylase RimI-like enzyme